MLRKKNKNVNIHKNLICNFYTLSLYFLTIFFCFSSISCKSQAQIKKEKELSAKEKSIHQNAAMVHQWATELQKNKIKAVEKYINDLPLEEKICQLFIVNLEGNSVYHPVEKLGEISKIVKNPNSEIMPGGYLFFSFNIANTPQQIMAFTNSIQNFAFDNNKIPPFLAVDQEGGYVNRLKNINGKLPSQKRVALNYSINQAENLYSLQAQQMALLGFNMNLAPVIEVCTDKNKDFIEDRSFGNLQNVLDYGLVSVKAYENNKIATVVKHFPGNTNTDPHTGLPEIDLSEAELNESLIPFKEIIKENPSGVLMSHARTSQIDSSTPACLSSIWITDILRNKYNYKGIIFSDDIFMSALAKNGYPPEKAVVMAIEAGIDCIMISEKRIAKPAKLLYEKAQSDKDFYEKINAACKNIIQYKLDSGLLRLVSVHDDLSLKNKIDIMDYTLVSIHNNNEEINQRVSDFEKLKKINDESF
ncbi:MAG: glycoside hydrolase family 3 protein [Treponema sp.]|nr:glycoside hydrolase family 3 protein [Treponema sp.]